MTRVCKTCNIEQEIDNFWKHTGCAGGRRPVCKSCDADKQNARYASNPIKYRARAAKWRALGGHVLARYGITIEEKYQIFVKQGKACAICRTKNHGVNRKSKHPTEYPDVDLWHLDHHHVTGVIRGVLCSNCNHMIGNADDNIETLRQGIEYLSSPVSYGIIPNGSDLKKK